MAHTYNLVISDAHICFNCCLCFSLLTAGTFVLSNLGMFGVDRFDAILPPGIVSAFFLTVVAMY